MSTWIAPLKEIPKTRRQRHRAPQKVRFAERVYVFNEFGSST
ncbi:MAG: hypothetical protein ABI277_09700 [Burkholderiaceae bacterium]